MTAHRAWCTALAEQAELGVRNGKDELTWLHRLDDEHDNLRAALARPVPDGGGLRLIAALLLPWWLHERDQEARHWVDTHLAQHGRARPPSSPKPRPGAACLPARQAGSNRRAGSSTS